MSVLLLESGDAFLRESGTQRFLLESSADPPRKTLALVRSKRTAPVFTSGATAVSLTAGDPTWGWGVDNGTIADDDMVLVLLVHASNADATLTINDGGGTPYTLLSEIYNNSGSDTNIRVAYKRASSDTSISVDSSVTTSGHPGVAIIFIIRNVDWDDAPLDNVSIVTATGINSTHVDPPALTPNTTGAWVIAGGGAARDGSANINLNHASLSNVLSADNRDTNFSAGGAMGIYTGWTSGSYDAAAFTSSQSAGNSWAGFALVIRPAYQATQDVAPGLLTNSQTFYGPTVTPGAVTLAPSLLTNSQTFPAPAISTSYTLAPSLLTNDQTFFAPTITTAISLAPPLLTNAQTFYASAITSNINLAPPLLTNGQTFYGPTVSQGTILAPSLVTNSQTFYGPAVTTSYTIAPSLLTNAQTFPAPAITTSYALAPSLLTNTQTFYSPAITTTANIAPPLLTNSQTFPAPSITSAINLAPSLVTNAQTFYSPTVVPGPVTLAPGLLTNGQTFHAPAVTASYTLAPSLLTNAQTFYGPTVEGSALPFDSSAGLAEPTYSTLLVEIAPLDPADGNRKTIRATNVNDRRVTGLNDLIWRPAISEAARLSIRLFKGDFDGVAAPSGGSISLRLDQLVAQQADVRRFVWTGASIKIWSGRSGDAWPWDQVFEGLIGGNPRAERNGITLPIETNAEPFNADILTEIYAGTGGDEGGADLKDKPKPWLLGRCFNVEPVMIDAVNSVYQFSAYGQIEAITKLYERGSDFGASYGDYADYTALVAAAIPAGRWGTCLAAGMVRLGAPQVGTITGDVDGDKFGGTWRRKTGEIILRVATNAGAGALVNTTSLSDLDTAVAAVATTNQGRIGVYLTDQETLIDFAARLAAPCNAQAGISLLGELFVSRIAIDTASITLDAQQRQMPRVTKSIELGTKPPFSKIEMGYARSWHVHGSDEIAYYADLVERGRYDNAGFYREGNIVDLEDGSRWVYINAVPGSGNPPPDWPTTSNAYWDNLSPPLRFQVDVFLSPARVPVPADTDGVVTSYATAAFEFIARTTEGVDVSSAFLLTLASGGNPDGLTYSIDNGTDPPSVTVSGGLTAAESPGELTIDATGSGDYDGMVFQRTFTIDVDQTDVMLEQLLSANDQNGLTPPDTGQTITSVTLETTHPDGTVTYKATYGWTYDTDPAAANNFDGLMWCYVEKTSSGSVTLGGPSAPATGERNGLWYYDMTDLSFVGYPIVKGDPTKYYTFGFAKFRKVATSVDPRGFIYGPITQYGPFQPSSSQNFTGNVGGTAASTIATATGNFNNRNDRDSSTPTAPTVAGDGTAIDHVSQFNSSVNISFEWSYAGSEADIDGFEVVFRSSEASATAYTIGTSPVEEHMMRVPASKRATILYGVEPMNYYTFYVRSYRVVDPDIDASRMKVSAWVKSTASGENPYRPATSQAYYGDAAGTVDGTSAANVASWSSYANNGLNSDGTVKSGKVDTSAIIASSVTNSSEGSYTGFGTLSAPDTTNLYCIFEHTFTGHGLPIHLFAEAITEMYTTTDATAGDEFAIKFILTRSLATNSIVSMQDGGSLTTYASHISGGAVALTPNVAIRQYQHFGADATITQGAMLTKIGAVDTSPPGSVSSGVSLVYGLWFGKVASAYGDYVAGIRDRIAMAILETMR